MEKLIKEYRESLKLVNKAKNKLPSDDLDKSTLGGMSSDLQFAIQWMRTGKNPNARRGIENEIAYKREIPFSQLSHEVQSRLELTESRARSVSETDQQMIHSVLELLTERQRDVYIAIKGKCLTYEQTAEILKISKPSVQHHFQRSEKKIKTALQQGLIQLCFDFEQ